MSSQEKQDAAPRDLNEYWEGPESTRYPHDLNLTHQEVNRQIRELADDEDATISVPNNWSRAYGWACGVLPELNSDAKAMFENEHCVNDFAKLLRLVNIAKIISRSSRFIRVCRDADLAVIPSENDKLDNGRIIERLRSNGIFLEMPTSVWIQNVVTWAASERDNFLAIVTHPGWTAEDVEYFRETKENKNAVDLKEESPDDDFVRAITPPKTDGVNWNADNAASFLPSNITSLERKCRLHCLRALQAYRKTHNNIKLSQAKIGNVDMRVQKELNTLNRESLARQTKWLMESPDVSKAFQFRGMHNAFLNKHHPGPERDETPTATNPIGAFRAYVVYLLGRMFLRRLVITTVENPQPQSCEVVVVDSEGEPDYRALIVALTERLDKLEIQFAAGKKTVETKETVKTNADGSSVTTTTKKTVSGAKPKAKFSTASKSRSASKARSKSKKGVRGGGSTRSVVRAVRHHLAVAIRRVDGEELKQKELESLWASVDEMHKSLDAAARGAKAMHQRVALLNILKVARSGSIAEIQAEVAKQKANFRSFYPNCSCLEAILAPVDKMLSGNAPDLVASHSSANMRVVNEVIEAYF